MIQKFEDLQEDTSKNIVNATKNHSDHDDGSRASDTTQITSNTTRQCDQEGNVQCR